ncbi:MAG TPA: MFS transporter [Chitinophagaceae bacterium]|nr:MFS transporter [Chitinophagaceae bacterium]
MEQVRLGLKENLGQFTLLVVINAFVGGMVGMERSILPAMAEKEFAIAAKTAILSFIIVFGITKAITNYYTGALANRFGRRNLLITGWLVGLPIPLLLIYAPSWSWVIAANVLLGINQGLTWSSTVVMKIDLVGEKQRGLAMGLNEFAGYVAVALVAFLTGWIAGRYGVRPYPFYTGILLAVLGLAGSIFLIRDTKHHVSKESNLSALPRLKNIFWDTTWKNRNLGSVTQAGLVNNLNDGMAWGILPILLAQKGFTLGQIGAVTAVYPAVWGLGQLVTGAMADRYCKRDMLYSGMFLQAVALLYLLGASTLLQFVSLSVILGWGTAMVYPTFLATVAENTHPMDRAKSIGIFRLWRDLGYAIGAILTGLIADLISIRAAILVIGLLTLASSLIIRFRMHCRLDSGRRLMELILPKGSRLRHPAGPKSCLPVADLRRLLQQDPTRVLLIDVRNRDEYDQQHIPAAINIPLPDLPVRARGLQAPEYVLTVCGKGGGRSAEGANLLKQAGYANARYVCEGTAGWYATS